MVAVKYAAVAVVKGSDGVPSYSFVFHLRTDTGAIYSLSARYSVLRTMWQKLATEAPMDASTLVPPFPSRHPLRRQTSQFLVSRGRALEACLGAVLGDPHLNRAPALRDLLRTATLHTPAAPPASPTLKPHVSAPLAISPSPGPELRRWQQRQRSRHGGGDQAAAGTSRSAPAMVLDALLHPACSIAVAVGLGFHYQQLVLCLCCWAAGIVCSTLCARLSPASSSEHGGANGAKNGANGVSSGGAGGGANGAATAGACLSHAPPAASAAPPSRPATALPAAADAMATVAAAPAAGQPAAVADELDGHVARVGAEAVGALVRECDAACPAAGGAPERGWAFHSRKEDVSIYTVQRPTGPTWGLGCGQIEASPEAVLAASNAEVHSATLDRQLISCDVVRVVAPALCPLPGWEVLDLRLQHSLFKSPAWPVGKREALTVRIIARRVADGAFATAQRSISVPGIAIPPGYTRLDLEVGGSLMRPLKAGAATEVSYAQCLDPCGSIPKSVVKITVPERALYIARLRGCMAKPSS